MNPALSKAQYLIRREVWENKGSVFWTPVIIAVAVSVLIVLALALGRFTISEGNWGLEAALSMTDLAEKHGWNEDIDEPVKIIDFNSGTLVVTTEKNLGLGNINATPRDSISSTQHGMVIGFEVVAAIVAIVYLLGALFNDRKDRSILFWKSLPISETANVLMKLLFAITVIPFVALICSIPVQIVGSMAIAWVYSLSEQYSFMAAFSEISLIRVFLIHTVLLLALALKSLPFYSWLLLASSVSKRSPLLIAIIIPAVIWAVESLIFGTSYFADSVIGLFFTHGFDMDWPQTEQESLFRAAVAMISITFPQFIKIIVVSAVFLSGAIWCRNNRYEI